MQGSLFMTSQQPSPTAPSLPPGQATAERARFLRDFHQYGPFAQYKPPSLRYSQRYCRRLTRQHYENFTVVSWFVPRGLRQHFCNIYAWCRWADDLADEIFSQKDSLMLLDWWQRELMSSYRGHPRHPVAVALQDTVTTFQIPPEPFLDLLVAFRQDQEIRRYETFEELLKYCRYSANPVGRLVLYLARCHTPERVTLSDFVCTGLQLANFWQDVGEDWHRGRMYIPLAECRRVGYTEEMWQRREFNPAFRTLMRGLVEEAAVFLCRGGQLVELMPRQWRVPVLLFVRGGLKILQAIAAIDYNVWQTRPTLSRWTKLTLMMQSWWDVLWHKTGMNK